MRKIAILLFALFTCSISFAQRAATLTAQPVHFFDQYIAHSSGAKTTALGDTLTLSHITSADTITIYKVGTNGGYATGINTYGDKAFAERYDYSDDTGKSMKVIGLFAMFHGKVNPASAKTVTFKLWSEGASQMISATRYYKGFPGLVLDSVTVPVIQLGIGVTTDTLKKFMFPGYDAYNTSFFIGYGIDYNFSALGGDTLGLACSKNGERHPAPSYTLSYHTSEFGDTVLDTTINVQNATLESDNVWYDNYSQNDSILNNLAIYPIVIMGHTSGVQPVHRNDLALFGCYPNPVVNSADVRFSLSSGADVTTMLMDINGRVLQTIQYKGLQPGNHSVTLDVASLPAGEYLYLIRTSAGDGIASKFVKE